MAIYKSTPEKLEQLQGLSIYHKSAIIRSLIGDYEIVPNKSAWEIVLEDDKKIFIRRLTNGIDYITDFIELDPDELIRVIFTRLVEPDSVVIAGKELVRFHFGSDETPSAGYWRTVNREIEKLQKIRELDPKAHIEYTECDDDQNDCWYIDSEIMIQHPWSDTPRSSNFLSYSLGDVVSVLYKYFAEGSLACIDGKRYRLLVDDTWEEVKK